MKTTTHSHSQPQISSPFPLSEHTHTHRRSKIAFAGASSRSSSTSSIDTTDLSTDTNSPSSSSPLDLQTLALTLHTLLYNDHDLTAAYPLIHPSIVASHNDDVTPSVDGREEYLRFWGRRVQRVPGLKARARECVVDEAQRKVWVVSELESGVVSGVGGDGEEERGRGRRRKESVDMLSFDGEGRLRGADDWVRVVRGDD